MVSVLLLGLLIGMQHALEADHVAAVASIAARAGSVRRVVRHGAVWGLGHSATLLVVGSAVVLLNTAVPEGLARVLELAAGVMLVFFRPFRVGDFVEVAGVSGKVEEVNVFQTRLKTGDNKVVIVGNSDVTSNSITNYSAEDTRRVDLVFGIGYDEELRIP